MKPVSSKSRFLPSPAVRLQSPPLPRENPATFNGSPIEPPGTRNRSVRFPMSQIPDQSTPGAVTGIRYTFAPRMKKTPRSFIREILKVIERPEIISFAGGLPSNALIDVEGIRTAANTVLEQDGRSALQYSTTEGYLPLRQFIADRYQQRLGLWYHRTRSSLPTARNSALTLSARS